MYLRYLLVFSAIAYFLRCITYEILNTHYLYTAHYLTQSGGVVHLVAMCALSGRL